MSVETDRRAELFFELVRAIGVPPRSIEGPKRAYLEELFSRPYGTPPPEIVRTLGLGESTLRVWRTRDPNFAAIEELGRRGWWSASMDLWTRAIRVPDLPALIEFLVVYSPGPLDLAFSPHDPAGKEEIDWIFEQMPDDPLPPERIERIFRALFDHASRQRLQKTRR